MTLAASTVVLFDWNGTVVLDAERARAALNKVLANRGLGVLDATRFSREFHLPMSDMFARLGVEDTDAAEREWNAHMRSVSTTARDGIEALRRLQSAGVRLGVVSAADRSAVGTDIDLLGMTGLWDSVDAPAADKLRVLSERRGDEVQAYYLGDTEYDMRCAVSSGYVPIAVSGGYTDAGLLREAGAAHILGSFSELEQLLIALQK